MNTNTIEALTRLSTDEAIKEQLRGIVTAAISAGKNAADFAVEQTPLLVQEIITYNIALHGFQVLLGIVAVLCIRPLALKVSAMCDDGNDGLGVPLCGGAGLAILFAVLFGLFSIPELLKVVFAPRLFLMEYLANIVK